MHFIYSRFQILFLTAIIIRGIPFVKAQNIRLVSGYTSAMGRVEVMYNGTWGTVCDDDWDGIDAGVVCSMLGYSRENAVAKKDAFFGAGSGTIWMDQVECTGSDVNLFHCSKSKLGKHDCSHGEDAGVICSLDNIRLVNGSLPYEGRVEIKHNGVWGTICDDGWDNKDAAVVCSMLGFPRNFATAKSDAFYGQGSGKIWIDDLSCSGHESNILQCNRTAIGKHNCQHSEDAGVLCSPAQNIRLVNGYTSAMGRVEVKNNGAWGTVCDDSWDDRDAAVVCSMLGFPRENGVAKNSAFFGAGHGSIWMDEVRCTGTETNLFHCSKSELGDHDCSHGEDAGVICSLDNIRLVNGSLPYEGRVEIKHNGVWGTICDDEWDNKDAAVVCSMLGFPRNFATAKSGAFYGQGSGKIWIDDLSCNGHESIILQCNSTALGTHNCQHSEDAGVLCSRVEDVRLANGSTTAMGRVEIKIKGAWGTICNNDWDDNAASVVCSMLGFSRKNAVAKNGSIFEPRYGPIWMDKVKCTGNEINLFQCPKAEFGDDNCDHSKDLGVTCSLDLRIVNGSSAYEGRVEVKFDGVWGTVCDDEWDNNDAAVVCGMLGFSRENAVAKRGAFFGKGKGTIWMDDVECTEDDRNIAHCKARELGNENCGHHEDAGVICAPEKIRLVNGSSSTDGRVEIMYRGVWGSVCNDGWDDRDATVVCLMLGFSRKIKRSRAESFKTVAQQRNNAWMADVQCKGNELDIFHCNHSTLIQQECSQNYYAAVNCTQGKVKLVSGQTPTEGLVKVFYNGSWGTVCNDEWDDRDAAVVCFMLGFSRQNATALTSSVFGYETGRILMNNVMCNGDEEDLFQCNNSLSEFINCDHRKDAGVVCSADLEEDSINSDENSVFKDEDVTRIIVVLASVVGVAVFVVCLIIIASKGRRNKSRRNPEANVTNGDGLENPSYNIPLYGNIDNSEQNKAAHTLCKAVDSDEDYEAILGTCADEDIYTTII